MTCRQSLRRPFLVLVFPQKKILHYIFSCETKFPGIIWRCQLAHTTCYINVFNRHFQCWKPFLSTLFLSHRNSPGKCRVTMWQEKMKGCGWLLRQRLRNRQEQDVHDHIHPSAHTSLLSWLRFYHEVLLVLIMVAIHTNQDTVHQCEQFSLSSETPARAPNFSSDTRLVSHYYHSKALQ